MSVGAGLYFNSSLLNQAAGVMVVNDEQYTFGPEWYALRPWPWPFTCWASFSWCLSARARGQKPCLGGFCRQHDHRENAEPAGLPDTIIPVTISLAFGVQSIPAIIIAVIWALAWTGYFKKLERHW